MDRRIAQRIRRLTTTLAIFSLVVLLALPGHWPPLHTVLAAAIAICVAELVAVRAGLGNQGWSISLTETVIACALLVQPGPWIVASMAVGMTAALLLRRGKDPIKVAFNAAMHSATAAAAAAVVVALGGNIISVCAGMLVCWTMNLVVVGKAIGWVSRKPLRELLSRHLNHSAMASASNTSLGLLAGILIQVEPATVVLLAPPIVLVMWIYTTVWRQNDATGVLNEVVQAHEQARMTTPHSIAAAVSRVSRNTLGGDEVTVIVIENGRAPSAYACPDGGSSIIPRDPNRAMATWWARIAMTRNDSLSTGVRSDKAWLVMRVGDPDDPAAIIHVSRSLSGRGPFTRGEQRIATHLLNQTTSWVDALADDVPDCGDSRLGARARRSQRSQDLQTATSRLMDVANSPSASVESLIEATRTVDSIVADMVGQALRPGTPDEADSPGPRYGEARRGRG